MPSTREHLIHDTVERLPLADKGQYRVLDDELPGFWVPPVTSPSTRRTAPRSVTGAVISGRRGTVAVAAGIGDMEAHLLLNHKLRGVSAGDITKGALLPHLVRAQERVSSQILQWVRSDD